MKTLEQIEIPEGYIPGVSRKDRGTENATHLYKGDFDNPGLPMCKSGYNEGIGYSIFRNRVSDKGVCKICLSRAKKGLDGVSSSDKV